LSPDVRGDGAVPAGHHPCGDGEQATSPSETAREGGEEENQKPLQICEFGVGFFHHFQQGFSQVPAANPIVPPACAGPGHGTNQNRIPPEPATNATGERARLSSSTKTPEKSHVSLAATTAARSENGAGGGTARVISRQLSRTPGHAAEPGRDTRLGGHLPA